MKKLENVLIYLLRLLILVLIILMLTVWISDYIQAQDFTRPYPRTYVEYFASYGRVTPWIIAKADMALFWHNESSYIASYKAINPNLIAIATSDWNRGQIVADATPEGNDITKIPTEWIAKHTDGSLVAGYSDRYQLDPTDYCSTYTGDVLGTGIAASNERYNDYLIRVLPILGNRFDGFNSDGCWFWAWSAGGDIDLNEDGVNDYNSTWARTAWKDGWRKIANGLRATGKKVSINYGSGVSGDSASSTSCNGGMWENGMSQLGVDTYSGARPYLELWNLNGPTPRINQMAGWIQADYVGTSPDNACFQMMRWWLGISLLHGFYFKLGDDIGSGENGMGDGHWTAWFYDEYKAKIGQPTGVYQAISGKSGCYFRAFDSGAVIVNTSNVAQTISVSNISGLTGYNPPYYTFIGSQDTTWNSGEVFTSKIFNVHAMSTYPTKPQYIGDAIILVKASERYAIEDIIIDNHYQGTTSGQSKTVTSGSWTNSTTTYSGYRMSGTSSTYCMPFIYASAGSGAYATFTPKINVSGDYDVYEWHGYQGGGASNNSGSVPHIITTADGIDTIFVNQKVNGGQMNLLGRFKCALGTSNSVRIHTIGASTGQVVGDAIFYVFVPPDYPVPSTKKVLFKKD